MIDIILATYNGEKFLRQQLESIINSDKYDELVNSVIVTDDNSTDSTRHIVSEYLNYKVKLITNIDISGVCGNFLNGLKYSSAEYVMFCDQDDIWLSSKIVDSYRCIKDLESSKGKDYPLVCFCDLEITDESLVKLEDSFINYHHIKLPYRLEFNKLVLNNVAPGCSSIINKKMVDYVLKGKKHIQKWIMHDWWIMLIASRLGYISFIPSTLIQYRQHTGNVVGYKKNSLINKIIKIKDTWLDYNQSLRARVIQYNALMDFINSNSIEKKPMNLECCKLERDVFFIIKNECTIKRKILGVINFCLNGFANR